MSLTAKSHNFLKQVHPHLAAIITLAAEMLPQADPDLSFQVTCGSRTVAEQKKLVARGASRTMNSRHIPAANGLSHAVDIIVYIDGRDTWEFPPYKTVSDIVKKAAAKLGYPIEWGGDWTSLRDGPHFQLPFYPYDGKGSAKDAPAPQPTEAELRTLMIGASGARVIELQKALNATRVPKTKNGVDLREDGSFGTATFNIVKAIQQMSGLVPDGIVGPKTWKVLGHG